MAKAKGSAVEGAVRALRKQRAAAERVLDPALHAYLHERVSPARWYPEEDLLGLVRAMLRLLPGDDGAILQAMGQATAQSHQEGTYGHLITDASGAHGFTVRTMALWSSMHDTGRMRATAEGDHAMRVVLDDYAHPSREMCAIVGAYVQEVLRLSGFASPRVAKRECVVDGAPACVWECDWSAAG